MSSSIRSPLVGDDPLSIMSSSSSVHVPLSTAASSDPLSSSSSSSSSTSSSSPRASASTSPFALVSSPLSPLSSSVPASGVPHPRGASSSVSTSASSLSLLSASSITARAIDPDDIVPDADRSSSARRSKPHGGSTGALMSTAAAAASAASAIPTEATTKVVLQTVTVPAGYVPSRTMSLPMVNASSLLSPSTSSSSSSSPAVPTHPRRVSQFSLKFLSSLPLRSRDWTPSIPASLSSELADDCESHGSLIGERAVMSIPGVLSYNAHDDAASAVHALFGTLRMTSYQLYLEPTQRRDQLGYALQTVPLSTIERIDAEKAKASSSSSSSSSAQANVSMLGANYAQLHYLDVQTKDGRFVKFGFREWEECKKAYNVLTNYVYPTKEEYLFAFSHRLRTPLPRHLDGWELYDPLEEYARQGVNTIPLTAPATQTSTALRLSWANERYTLCNTYPRVLLVPAEQFVSDADLHVAATFRSRGRIPACSWKHPRNTTTIWRCSQPRVGINNARCAEDEKLLLGIATNGDKFAIYDARPKFNARANIFAGKGFENVDLYRNCSKKIQFMDIQNIHVMRDSYNKLIKACQREVHDAHFQANVAASGWIGHLACCLKATAEMVRAVDQEKTSLLIHCSDGWDRTAQLASLCELCLDPFYRTTRGFFILIEKEWLAFGHQFQKRNGQAAADYNNDQRSCIFLQWCDTVYQLLHQFPRHFEFNSYLLVTLVHHMYSCRFGTFFGNSDLIRRRNKIRENTVSVWTYFICSPAAVRGEFTNGLYSKYGDGTDGGKLASPIAPITAITPSTTISSAGLVVPPANVDDALRSSIGRGGGDGSTIGTGTVLYPSWSAKKLVLWSDYFLRFANEQMEQVNIGPNAGSIAPHGATTTRIVGNDSVYQCEIRKLNDALRQSKVDNHTMNINMQQQATKMRELENELKRMKGTTTASSAADTADGAEHDITTATSTLAITTAESTSPHHAHSASSSAIAHAMFDDDDATISMDDEDDDIEDHNHGSPSHIAPRTKSEVDALEVLRKRLRQDVDASVREEVGAEEDPKTL